MSVFADHPVNGVCSVSSDSVSGVLLPSAGAVSAGASSVPISLRRLRSVCVTTGSYGSSRGGSLVESGLPPGCQRRIILVELKSSVPDRRSTQPVTTAVTPQIKCICTIHDPIIHILPF